MAVSFEVSKPDQELIFRIAERADEVGLISRRTYPKITCVMDLTAVHTKTPLRLNELLDADQFNFVHDIAGIARHLDRDTGNLGGFFTPRFSQFKVA
jgi:hypothetical protein